MHCAAHVIAIINIAIVVISMIMNHALLVTNLLSVSVMQDEALHMESAVPRPTIYQKVSSVNVMQDEAFHRRSQLPLGPRYLRKSLGPRSTDGPRG